MGSATFRERRKQNASTTERDQRNGDRRKEEVAIALNKRRVAAQARHYERLNFHIPIHLKLREKEVQGHTGNINQDGLLLICNATVEVGTPLTLQFSFGKDFCYMNIAGQVVFCAPMSNGAQGQQAVGIKFSGIRDWEQKVLISAVQELNHNSAIREHSLLSVGVREDDLAIEAARFHIENPSTLPQSRSVVRRSCVHASKIVGWGACLPDHQITSEVINKMVKTKDYKNVGEVVESLTGIKSRRYANSDVYPSDLAAMAAMDALKMAQVDPVDLDVIIFCGISRDFDEPATANTVQEKIGAKNSYVFDLSNACNGFITGLDVLDSMIASGRCETGIVVTGEHISPYIDFEPKTRKDLKLSLFGYTIGDAGGAAVLTRANGDGRGIKARGFSSNGTDWRVAVAGSLEGANNYNKFFKSEGAALEKAAVKYMPTVFENMMEILEWDISEVALVVPHQIPVSLLKSVYSELGIPNEKISWTFPKYGNTATASMAVAMCEALETNRVKVGDKVLLIGGASGFSVGMMGLIF